jgi:hypothetical protein
MTGVVMPVKAIMFTLVGLVVLVFGIGGFNGLSAPVSAQVTEQYIEIFQGQSGSFEVTIAVFPREPVVGNVFFSVEVLDTTTMNTVTDARVLIVAYDEDGLPAFQTLVLNTPLAPDSYEGNMPFELPSRYSLRVDIDSSTHGSTSFRVPMTVLSGTPIENPMGTWIFVLVVGAIVGGTVYVGFSAQRAQRRRAAA